jgi:hypothetical protein
VTIQIPIIITVPKDQMEAARHVGAQIIDQIRGRINEGILFLPEAIAETGIVDDDAQFRFLQELDRQREAAAAGKPFPVRHGVPGAPPATPPRSPSGLSQPGTDDPFAVLGYTKARVREALWVAVGILEQRATPDHPHGIGADAIILRTLADRA